MFFGGGTLLRSGFGEFPGDHVAHRLGRDDLLNDDVVRALLQGLQPLADEVGAGDDVDVGLEVVGDAAGLDRLVLIRDRQDQRGGVVDAGGFQVVGVGRAAVDGFVAEVGLGVDRGAVDVQEGDRDAGGFERLGGVAPDDAEAGDDGVGRGRGVVPRGLGLVLDRLDPQPQHPLGPGPLDRVAARKPEDRRPGRRQDGELARVRRGLGEDQRVRRGLAGLQVAHHGPRVHGHHVRGDLVRRHQVRPLDLGQERGDVRIVGLGRLLVDLVGEHPEQTLLVVGGDADGSRGHGRLGPRRAGWFGSGSIRTPQAIVAKRRARERLLFRCTGPVPGADGRT